MILVLRHDTTTAQLEELQQKAEALNLEFNTLKREGRTVLHLSSGLTSQVCKLERLDCVEGVVRLTVPDADLRPRAFFPYHMTRWIAGSTLVLGLLVLLTGLYPPGLGGPVDLSSSGEVIAPWYFRALDSVRELFPEEQAGLAALVVMLAGLLLFLLPVLDRTPGRTPAERKGVLAVGLVVLLASIALSLRGVL